MAYEIVFSVFEVLRTIDTLQVLNPGNNSWKLPNFFTVFCKICPLLLKSLDNIPLMYKIEGYADENCVNYVVEYIEQVLYSKLNHIRVSQMLFEVTDPQACFS